MVQRLAERYGETLRSMGLHQNDGLVEIYSSETTGTWTILMTRPDGTDLPARRRPALGAGRPADRQAGRRRLSEAGAPPAGPGAVPACESRREGLARGPVRT